MKKNNIFLIIALVMISISAYSQTNGPTFGLRAGVNLQTINGKDIGGDKLEMDIVPRFHVGAVVNIPFAPDFYFQPGLLFSTKGAKSNNSFLGLVDFSVEYNISYIELPLNIVFKPALGNGHFVLGFGPYLAYGVAGKAKFEINNVSTEEKIVFTDEHTSLIATDWKYFKALDYGGNLFFGYEMNNGISLQLNTQLGLAKINAENKSLTDNDSEFRNTGFGLSLGYNF